MVNQWRTHASVTDHIALLLQVGWTQNSLKNNRTEEPSDGPKHLNTAFKLLPLNSSPELEGSKKDKSELNIKQYKMCD